MRSALFRRGLWALGLLLVVVMIHGAQQDWSIALMIVLFLALAAVITFAWNGDTEPAKATPMAHSSPTGQFDGPSKRRSEPDRDGAGDSGGMTEGGGGGGFDG